MVAAARRRGKLGAWRSAASLLVLVCGTMLAACGAGGGLATEQDVVVGQEQAAVVLAAASDQPALPRDQAIHLAEQQAPTWPVATAVTAHYLRLTLRDLDGQVRAGMQDRPVWLVTFVGAAFLPPNAPQPGCPCKGYYQRANTAVALDARTGVLVTIYGVNSDGRA